MPEVMVIGGANIDWFACPKGPLILHTSNPGTLRKAYGGVGRNIAENLARLDVSTAMITLVGEDEDGRSLRAYMARLGVAMQGVSVPESPKYLAVLDADNDMHVAIAAMTDFSILSPALIDQYRDSISSASIVVVDTNLELKTLDYVFKTVKNPIYVDTISTQKALKMKPYLANIHTLKMNLLEAAALSGLSAQHDEGPLQIAKYFLNQGVQSVHITLGEQGALHATRQGVRQKRLVATRIINTTGAGDGYFAGVIYADLRKQNALHCGTAVAAITLQHENAVSESLTPESLHAFMKENEL